MGLAVDQVVLGGKPIRMNARLSSQATRRASALKTSSGRA
jgi:hypothetical protein